MRPDASSALYVKLSPCWTPLLPTQGATNFALVSTSATSVSLVLFTEEDLERGLVTYEVPLCDVANRSGGVWHVMLPDLRSDLLYGA